MKPKVSVITICYNHEKYISETIEGVLMQNTDFDFELIIGDDSSTDKTALIIKEYVEKYPSIIKPILNSKNIGGNKNYFNCYKMAKGDYIASCEGDDFWTDPYKLQKQVDFLQVNIKYVMCFHDAIKLDEIGTSKSGERMINKNESFEVSTEDLLVKNRANTLTVMYRNNLIKDFPDWIYGFKGGDRFLYLLLSQYGKIIYLPFIGSTYRLHQFGASNFKRQHRNYKAMLNHYRTRIEANEILNSHFNYRYNKLISSIIKDYALLLFELYFFLKEYSNCLVVIQKHNLTLLTKTDYRFMLKFLYVLFHKKLALEKSLKK